MFPFFLLLLLLLRAIYLGSKVGNLFLAFVELRPTSKSSGLLETRRVAMGVRNAVKKLSSMVGNILSSMVGTRGCEGGGGGGVWKEVEGLKDEQEERGRRNVSFPDLGSQNLGPRCSEGGRNPRIGRDGGILSQASPGSPSSARTSGRSPKTPKTPTTCNNT